MPGPDHRFSVYKMIHHDMRSPWPIHVQMDITGSCNHGCVFCYWRKGARNQNYKGDYIKEIPYLETETVLKALDEFRDAGVKAITFVGGGEPLIHKDIDKILRRVIDNGFHFGVITNLSRLPGSLDALAAADWIRVSLDAATDDAYQLMHAPEDGTTLAAALENVKRVVGRTEVGASFMVHRLNRNEIYKAAETMKSLGARYIQFKPVYDKDRGKSIADFMDEIKRQLDAASALSDEGFEVVDLLSRVGQMSAASRGFDICRIHNYQIQLGVDGNIYPCCVLKYVGEFSFGNIRDSAFKEIWNSAKRKDVVPRLNSRDCPNCWFDKTNEFLEYSLAEKTAHAYFV
ncbi:MAG: radical SAM protein [Candidatus Nitrospinota bacterium M3_3B_026]